MVDSKPCGSPDKVTYGFKPQADGTVTLILATRSRGNLQLSIPIEDLAGFTAAALHSARVASGLSGKGVQEVHTIDANLSGTGPDRIGLALGPATDQVSLVAHFGAAVLALPFKKGEATLIGHALLAAGTSSKDAQ